MKRYSVVGVVEIREGTTRQIDVVHEVNTFAENEDEARDLVTRNLKSMRKGCLIGAISILEIT